MKYTVYTKKERLAHLERAKADMEKGTGTFHSYALAAGISLSTFYMWVHTYGYGKDTDDGTEACKGFVNLGKTSHPQPPGERKFVVDFCGSRIEVTVPSSLLELLKGIRIESPI